VTGLDLFLGAKLRSVGDATRQALASQFALFAELDPPSTRELAAERFRPSAGAALQIAQTAIAVDGREVARLNAVGSDAGRQRVQEALFAALARASEAPLSCLVDRRVTWGDARELLSLARLAGATEAELLLTRGTPPEIPRRGPPEVSWVTRHDFVAVRVSLADQGIALDPAQRFEQFSPALIEAAKAGRTLALAVPYPGRDPGR
jgi:hypothetical protein